MIVDCAAYRDGRRVNGETLSLDEVAPQLADPDGFVWLGLRMPDVDQMRQVAETFHLDDLDCDAAVAPHDRPVLAQPGDATSLGLRTSVDNDKLEQVMLGELSLIFTDHFVVTVRYGQASPLDGVRRELEAEPDELRYGTASVVAAIVRRVVDDYGPALDGFEGDVMEAEHQ